MRRYTKGPGRVLFPDDPIEAEVPEVPTGEVLTLQIGPAGRTIAVWGDAGASDYLIMETISNETDTLTTGVAKYTFRSPFNLTVIGLPRINLAAVSTSGNVTVDINKSGASMFSTPLTIDVGTKTSVTAAVPAVVSNPVWDDDAEITVDVDSAGTGAKGLKLIIIAVRTNIQALILPIIGPAATLFPPAVALLDQAVTLGTIVSTETLYPPTLQIEQAVTAGTIASGSTLYAPMIAAEQSVTGGTIASTVTLSAPTVEGNFMQSFAGAFNIGTGAVTTTKAVTGVGFQPDVVLLFWSGETASGNNAISTTKNFHSGFGVALSSSSRRGGCSSAIDATSPTQIRNHWRSDSCVVLMSSSVDATSGLADFVSMDSDGFTLVIDEQFTSDLRIQYLAFRRTGMSKVLGSFTLPATTGSQVVSSIGLGTTPTFLLIFGYRTNGGGVGMNSPFGVSDGTNQWCFDMDQAFGTTAGTQSRHYLRSGEIIGLISAANPPTAIDNRASLTSLGSDQFTLNWIECNGVQDMHYLALAGVNAAVGASDSSATNFTISGLGFKPSLEHLRLTGDQLCSADTVKIEAKNSMGIATGPSNRFAHLSHSLHNAGASVQAFVAGREDCIGFEPSNFSPFTAIRNQVDVQSFDAAGITHVRDVNGGTTLAHAWFVLGPGA